jgi:hypothetical protein
MGSRGLFFDRVIVSALLRVHARCAFGWRRTRRQFNLYKIKYRSVWYDNGKIIGKIYLCRCCIANKYAYIP